MCQQLTTCNICPRQCSVDRKNQHGFCGIFSGIVLSSSVVHYGEESVLSENEGIGNFFFTSCNMACVYCQNYQISQQRQGHLISETDFISQMFHFQNKGCSFIGLVSPSHQSPWIRGAVKKAKQDGLHTPIIYNSAAYDDLDQLKLWKGLIDVYLPDIRYADNAIAKKYSNVNNYVDISKNAISEMYRQVGPPKFDSTGKRLVSGLWVRHLVLPDHLAGSWESLCFLALELSADIGLSLMAQYNPLYRAHQFPELSRMITQNEYDSVVDMATSLGFKHILCQDLESSPQHYVPDFCLSDPFCDSTRSLLQTNSHITGNI